MQPLSLPLEPRSCSKDQNQGCRLQDLGLRAKISGPALRIKVSGPRLEGEGQALSLKHRPQKKGMPH